MTFNREKTQGISKERKGRYNCRGKNIFSYLFEDNVGISSTNTLNGCDGEHDVSFTYSFDKAQLEMHSYELRHV